MSNRDIPEKRGAHHVSTQVFSEGAMRQYVPGYGVCDGREYPVQLAEDCFAVIDVSREVVSDVYTNALHCVFVLTRNIHRK